MYLVPVLEYTSIFETLGQKMIVLLSIFCVTKITLVWIPLILAPPFIITYLTAN